MSTTRQPNALRKSGKNWRITTFVNRERETGLHGGDFFGSLPAKLPLRPDSSFRLYSDKHHVHHH
jgi:hypothetical protein